jgi:PhzF family phenazine biosynthesis protein
VDVFSADPYRGNPVAVILDADGLDDEAMQRIASWTNLSETTFVMSASTAAADYRVRIFTPGGELPFAGHPTLGTARAWLSNGGRSKREGMIVQECGAGLVEVRQDGELLSFAAPQMVHTGPLEDDVLSRIVKALGITGDQLKGHQWVDNGPGGAAVQLATAAEVLALEPKMSAIPDLTVGVIGAYPPGSECAFEVRAFAAGIGGGEDPVTGSLNASLAQWFTSTGRAPERYTVSQGTRLGRTGRIHITADGGTVWVGGVANILFAGTAIA